MSDYNLVPDSRTTISMISFETHSVANGKKEEIIRRTSVLTLSAGLVCQTIWRSGGTFRSAWRRSRHVLGTSELRVEGVSNFPRTS